MKKILLLSALLLLIVGGIVLVQNYFKEGKMSFFKKASTVTIAGQTFKVTVAASQKEQEMGLSQAKSLAQDHGMLFVFPSPNFYSFWMRDMKFPIDIIYINKDTIVTIVKNAPILKSGESLIIYNSTKPADKVLEIRAGLSEKYKFKNGDKVTYENLGTESR